MRGNGSDDIFVVGDYGFCAHFNGVSWAVYPELYLPNSIYHGLAIRGNMMVAVGEMGDGKAIITIGKRV